MAETGGDGGEKPKGMGSQMMMFMIMPLLLLLMFTPELRTALGLALDVCLGPTIGFNLVYPLFTIACTSTIMVFCTTLLRHKYTDWVAIGKQSYLQKFVQKKFKEAQGNPQKLKKVQELNAEIMKMTGDRMSTQMKTMMFTMVFSLLLFMWLLVFIYTQTSVHIISAPWAIEEGWSLTDNGALIEALTQGESKGPMPNWILLYSMFSIPIGQVLQAGFKYFTFDKRLKQMERGELPVIKKKVKKVEKEKKLETKEGGGLDVVEGDFEIEEEGEEEEEVLDDPEDELVPEDSEE